MLYDLIYSINQRLIMGENIDDVEKQCVVDKILTSPKLAEVESGLIEKFATAKYASSQVMYPSFFTPSKEERNGKLRLITGELPKTKILSDNAYELEIIRLLALWARGNDKVESILYSTEKRLEKTCFASFCSKGECTGASIAYLRFWTAYKPEDICTQKKIINRLKTFRDGNGLWKKSLDIPHYYAFSSFSECSYESVEDELLYCKNTFMNLLNKTWLNESNHLLLKYVIKNALSRIPGYEYIADTSFYVGKDNRWHSSIKECSIAY